MKTAPVINKSRYKGRTIVKDKSFFIVAIGASAGGLEAVTQLLQHLSSPTGMAFFYVQHLSPDHKSMLSSLLSKTTSMKVQEVKNKMQIEPENLYIIPPDKEMEVVDGHVRLTPRSKARGLNLPIDTFFTSLAENHKTGAIGIILSGSASDGTLGMKAIKHQGGLTFAQDDSAKFKSMPKSAVASGAVDFILSPQQIALELTLISHHPFVKNYHNTRKEDLIDNSDPDLKIILQQVNKITGVDFSAYKMKTIKRRIIRRMLLYKIKDIKEYAKMLIVKNEEIDILFQDLLINVTSFFRDTDTHHYLKTILFPKLLKIKKPGEALRIWVAACATGEEAYSFAMMLLEIQDGNFSNIPIQIFASDLSSKAISKARIGIYTKQELESVSPQRLQRFYTKCDLGYRISKSVRDICVFAQHNILRDPPFSRLDFISCCNLFIYLDTAAQKKIISIFHYAIKDNGYLMLGKSESIGSYIQLFSGFNKKYKIFTRKNKLDAQPMPALLPMYSNPPATMNDLKDGKHMLPGKKIKNYTPKIAVVPRGLESAIDAVLMADFLPASVVINHGMEILQFRGATDLYLRHSTGKATFDILKMAHPEIIFELRNAILKAIKTKHRVRKNSIEIKSNATMRTISLEVVPLNIEWDEPLLLIIFSEQEQVDIVEKGKMGKTDSLVKDRRIKKLEDELAAARDDANAYAQEQEAFTEELQSANEEIVSSNEELQSVNEELETSKEEIESTNEELVTTNQELQTRNDLLNESYEFSEAIISTVHEPMIILDKDLRIKSANKSFYKNFLVNEAGTEGELLYELGNKQWDIPILRELLEGVIRKNYPFENYEVRHTFPEIGEKIMLLNANQLVQKIHGVQLILLAINDVTQRSLQQNIEKEHLKKDISESKSYNQKLEIAVEERTGELGKVNKILEEKNYELKQLNKELQAFAYISSHDLQEPLRKIQTFATRILEKEVQNLSDNGKDYFNRMEKAAKRMQQLIDDLLAFSHVSISDRKFENIEFTEIVEEVKAELKEVIDEKRANIKLTRSCKVNIIPFQFRQLIENLLSNALKFSNPEQPPQVIINCIIIKGSKIIKEKHIQVSGHLDKVFPEKNYYHISFTDNGIGFEPHFNERIFDVFQKLHSKDKYPGTGIGLAIVKKIVENHNGIITAKGELGKGATFDIYIPA